MTGYIHFNNAELLGYSHNFNFWGQARHYSSTQVYNIKSYITGAKYQEDNIYDIWNQSNNISNYTKSGICQIHVNNVYLGLGRVTSINFDESLDVRIRKYSAQVEIPLVAGPDGFAGIGEMANTGLYFSGSESLIGYFTSETGKYINNFTFSQSSEQIASGKYVYSKTASFGIDKGIEDVYSVTPVDYAKRVFGAVSKLYGNEYILSPEYPTFYQLASGISKTNQSFDTLNNTFSYDEKFTFQSGMNYLWQYGHSLNYDGKTATIDEKGTITSSLVSGTKIAPAITAWTSIETGIYARCESVFSGYFYSAGLLSPSYPCNIYPYPINKSITKNQCAATVDYSYSYSNSPFIQSGYFYSYSDSVDYGEDGYLTISENGTFKAISNINSGGWTVVKNAYAAEKPNITGRISGIYANSTGWYHTDCGYLSGGLKSASKRETFKEYDAEVSYVWSFTDNPSFHEDSVSYSYRKNVSDNKSLHLFNYFPILGDKIISQSAQQATRGQLSNSISIVSKSGVSLSSLAAKALSGVEKPSGTDIYATNYTYSYSPLTNNFSLGLDYVYTYYRDKDQFLAH